jgi:hypothetical protein
LDATKANLAGIKASAKALGMADIYVRMHTLENGLAALKNGETPPPETAD